jgi:hypothetical protein
MVTSAPPTALVIPPPDTGTNAVVGEELRDVKPPVPIVNLWNYAIAAVLLALFAALVVGWMLRRRRRRKQAPPTVVAVPPHRLALDQLRAALDLLHDPKAFTIRVADTLRRYLEERFQLNAPDRTSEEFLEEVQSSSLLTQSQKEILADFLTRCDLVKFAQAQPPETELRGLWDTAMSLVSDTSEVFAPSDSSP